MRAGAELIEVTRSTAEACEATVSFAESRAIARQDAIEAHAKASAAADAMKASSEISDLTSLLAAQLQRNDVARNMLEEEKRQRKEEMERSESRYRQLEADSQRLLREHVTKSTGVEESLRASLEEERLRGADAEGEKRAALKRITEVEAEVGRYVNLLKEERQRGSGAEGRVRAALERITKLEAEGLQREVKTAALEAAVGRIMD